MNSQKSSDDSRVWHCALCDTDWYVHSNLVEHLRSFHRVLQQNSNEMISALIEAFEKRTFLPIKKAHFRTEKLKCQMCNFTCHLKTEMKFHRRKCNSPLKDRVLTMQVVVSDHIKENPENSVEYVPSSQTPDVDMDDEFDEDEEEEDDEDDIELDFDEGQLVSAKLGGFPFWPGIVLRDTRGHIFNATKNQYSIHFFDKNDKMTQAWISQKSIKPFPYVEKEVKKPTAKRKKSLNKPKPIKKSTSERLDAARKWADFAFEMSNDERLNYFGQIFK